MRISDWISDVCSSDLFACWDGQDRGPLQADNLDQIVSEGRNDLQPPAITLLPEIGDVLAVLDGLDGVRLARMSGSGATCFALLKDDAALAYAAAALVDLRPHWWVMTSRSEEHTSELQSLMRISYAVFCLKK